MQRSTYSNVPGRTTVKGTFGANISGGVVRIEEGFGSEVTLMAAGIPGAEFFEALADEAHTVATAIRAFEATRA